VTPRSQQPAGILATQQPTAPARYGQPRKASSASKSSYFGQARELIESNNRRLVELERRLKIPETFEKAGKELTTW